VSAPRWWELTTPTVRGTRYLDCVGGRHRAVLIPRGDGALVVLCHGGCHRRLSGFAWAPIDEPAAAVCSPCHAAAHRAAGEPWDTVTTHDPVEPDRIPGQLAIELPE